MIPISDNQNTENKMDMILLNQSAILSALQWANGSSIGDVKITAQKFQICQNIQDMNNLNTFLENSEVYDQAVSN